MNLRDYQDGIEKFAKYPRDKELEYLALGLGEAGEVQGKVKKILRGDKTVDEAAEGIIDELGDVLWYVTRFCSYFGITVSDLAERNYKKLSARAERNTILGSGDNR